MVIRFGTNGNNGPNFTDEQIHTRMRNATHKIESKLPRIHSISAVDETELVIGKKLGEGAFCSVRSVSLKGQNMALKELNAKACDSRMQYTIGMRDLGTEAAVLAGLDHPNIVTLHGISSGSLQERIAGKKERRFFLLMDQVDGTLEQRLGQWKKENAILQPSKGPLFFFKFHWQVSQESWSAFVQQRLPIALEIAQAMQYLHKQGVMYRDLKPGNVGLDESGWVKLLDFGLATTDSVSRECAGSRRYMAPEVALHKQYTSSVDVYSFGMLLWYMCTLQKPFEDFSGDEHMERVIWKGERPDVPCWWPRPLQNLLKQCWCQCPSQRMSMDDVVTSLERMIQKHKQTKQDGRSWNKQEMKQPGRSPRNKQVVPIGHS